MSASLAQLHQRLGVTTVYVTHDQTGAMTLGQRVAVMRDGKVLQVDTPKQLYERPTNLFIAAFIGSPAMNLAEPDFDGEAITFGGHRIPLAAGRRPAPRAERASRGSRSAMPAHGRSTPAGSRCQRWPRFSTSPRARCY